MNIEQNDWMLLVIENDCTGRELGQLVGFIVFKGQFNNEEMATEYARNRGEIGDMLGYAKDTQDLTFEVDTYQGFIDCGYLDTKNKFRFHLLNGHIVE